MAMLDWVMSYFRDARYVLDGFNPSSFDMDTVVNLCDLHATPSLGNKRTRDEVSWTNTPIALNVRMIQNIDEAMKSQDVGDKAYDQHSYCFNVEDGPKIFDEAIKSQDVNVDVKTTFLNSELDEEVYMNQPQGFNMPGNKDNVCKLITSSHGLKKAPKQWHQKFDKVLLSNGYLLNQADKCVYSKFDESSKGVIIYLYVDDILIFSTDQV
ncbi:zinc finger, CCHC-type containing protein [Tanacetum coccineum]|uniref:Zinc finger, CCHC-type containing protein n=1 Tax=Tanacetum coccineum TaxID=301880 RepID=A0ABQ5C3T1_9ASTR